MSDKLKHPLKDDSGNITLLSILSKALESSDLGTVKVLIKVSIDMLKQGKTLREPLDFRNLDGSPA